MTTTMTDRLSTASGLAIKVPCRIAVLTNITLSGLQTIQSVALADGDRVLVAGQTSAVNNGIYVVRSGTWERAADCDGRFDLVTGSFVRVNSGTYANIYFHCTTANPIEIGTSSINWLQSNDPLFYPVSYSNIQNVSATDKLLGRVSAGAGVIEEVTCTAAGRALIDDADAAAQRTTLGLGTMSTQSASSVAVTGGSLSGVTVSSATISSPSISGATITGGTISGATITGAFSQVAPDAQFTHTLPSGTSGGTATSGSWQTRLINTQDWNTISGASLGGSGQITLPAGSYYFEAWSTFHRTDNSKIALYNNTDGSFAINGSSAYLPQGDFGGSILNLSGKLTIASTKVFEMRYFVTLTKTGDGLGLAVSSGQPEYFANIRIWKMS